MKRMTEEEFNEELRAIQEENLYKEQRRKLKEERRKGRVKRKLPSTSKIVLFCVIVLCVEIVIFCEWAMVKLYDTSSMYVLVGIPAALAPIIWGYYSKAKAENTGANGVGIVFQNMMNEYNANNESGKNNTAEDGSVG